MTSLVVKQHASSVHCGIVPRPPDNGQQVRAIHNQHHRNGRCNHRNKGIRPHPCLQFNGGNPGTSKTAWGLLDLVTISAANTSSLLPFPAVPFAEGDGLMAIVNVQGQTGVGAKIKTYYATLPSTAGVDTDLVLTDMTQIVQFAMVYPTNAAYRWLFPEGSRSKDNRSCNTIRTGPYFVRVASIVGNVFRYAFQQDSSSETRRRVGSTIK